jgi:hypothetical protein
MTSTFAPGRFIFNGGHDPRYAQSWITAPSLIALDANNEQSHSSGSLQWPQWALRWLALIAGVASISQLFSATMPIVNVALIAPDSSDAPQTRARVALLMFDLGLFSLLASLIVLAVSCCGCGCCSARRVLSLPALWTVQILLILEALCAILRAVLAAVFLVQDAHIVASEDPLWLLLCHRFASLFAALVLLASMLVVTRTAKIAARPSAARSYTKLDDFR